MYILFHRKDIYILHVSHILLYVTVISNNKNINFMLTSNFEALWAYRKSPLLSGDYH